MQTDCIAFSQLYSNCLRCSSTVRQQSPRYEVAIALKILACVLSSVLQLSSLAVAGVLLVNWSRTGAFITTAQRPGKGPDGQQAKNIKVQTLSAPQKSHNHCYPSCLPAGQCLCAADASATRTLWWQL